MRHRIDCRRAAILRAGITRREVIALIGSAVFAQPIESVAQVSARKSPHVVMVAPIDTPLFDAFRLRLNELGYSQGNNIVLDLRLMSALDTGLLHQDVDVLVGSGVEAVAKLQSITKTIPTVGIIGVDPVASGFAEGLAKPGGNFTGVTTLAIELHAKRLALLKEAVPHATRIAVLIDRSQDPRGLVLQSMQQTAERLGVRLERLDADGESLPRALRREVLTTFDGIVVGSGPLLWNNRVQIVELAANAGRPAIYPEREYADSGGLMSYGPNVPAVFRRLAEFVDRILKGGNPAEIPIEQVSRLDFIVNLRTARTLGITISPALVARADEVIE